MRNIWLNTKVQTSPTVSVRLDAQMSQNHSISELLDTRSYQINGTSISPGVEFRFSRSLQSGFSLSHITKEDEFQETPAKVRIYKVSNSSRAYLWEKIQTNLSVELRSTHLEGESSSQGLYQLTEGTGVGTNLVWSLSGTYRISQMVRFSLNYDGRTIQDRPDIHTIKLVMSAVF